MAKRKRKFGPQKKKKNMAKVQFYGCQEYGHYKSDYTKLKKEKTRGREEGHITEEVEEAEKKKSKEEVKDLYYD